MWPGWSQTLSSSLNTHWCGLVVEYNKGVKQVQSSYNVLKLSTHNAFCITGLRPEQSQLTLSWAHDWGDTTQAHLVQGSCAWAWKGWGCKALVGAHCDSIPACPKRPVTW